MRAGICLIIHEVGHVFDHVVGLAPRAAVARAQGVDATFPDRGGATPPNYAFAGRFPGWQQSTDVRPGEEFADMFVGWTYNTWADNEDGQARSAFMNTHMALWVTMVVGG
jgi:hypothetical protein